MDTPITGIHNNNIAHLRLNITHVCFDKKTVVTVLDIDIILPICVLYRWHGHNTATEH